MEGGCPTCSATLAMVFNGAHHKAWNCERCGTLVSDRLGHIDVYRPKLVDRCREFATTFPPGNPPSVSYSREWHRLGIAESIHRPEDRK